MFIPALFAKLLSAGAVAQAATGAGVAVVLVTGAGAAGALPGPVQDTVAGVVETVSPLELPDSGDTEDETTAEPVEGEDGTGTEEPGTEEPVVEEPVVEDPAAFDPDAWATEGPQDGETFGQWVSKGAHNKALLGPDVRFGQIVSTWAHKKHLDAEDLENEGVDLDELTDTPDEPATEVDSETAQTEQKATTTQSGSHGKGNGKGSGKGDADGSAKSTGQSNGNKGGNGKN